jgi:hypothetical protein
MSKVYYYVAVLIFLIISGSVTAHQESATLKKVELTLAMKCGCAPDSTHTPAALPDVRITGQDGAGNPFDTKTDISGYVVIDGKPGNWQFTASKEGYITNTWTMSVTETDTKYPYLLIDNTQWKNKVDASGSLSKEDLARLVMENFPEGDVPGKSKESIRATAYAVAMAESSGNPAAFGDQALGYSIGLWQINLCHHQNYNALDLFDPGYNADAALEISNGGTYWYPWSTWKNGAYKGYLKEGQDELDKLSGIIPKVTLTLYIHDSDKNGPVIPGVQVTCKDGSGNYIEEITDSSGYVTVDGDPGTWSFTASAEGYETKSWDQEITEKCTKRATLTKSAKTSKEQLVTVTLYVYEGNKEGTIISGAQVAGQDGLGKSFKGTAYSQGIDIKGYSGSWLFTVSASGYETNSWTEPITDYCTRNAFLQKSESHEPVQSNSEPVNQPSSQVTLTLYVHDGSASGPKISGAKVIGKDGLGNGFKKTTKSIGYITIEGDPGTWSFKTSADGYETNSWDQEITQTCTKHAFLKEEQQSSESSVVGKWAFHFIKQSWESSTDRMWQNPDSPNEWDSIIEFHGDGTFTELHPYMTITGEWIQNGDDIRLQSNPEEVPEETTSYEYSESLGGIIEKNTMSGTGSGSTHGIVTSGSFSYDIYETYSWSANRDD